MDFSQLDTSKKANEGTFLHLVHPGTGAKLHDGCNPQTGAGGDLNKKVGIYLLGKDSDANAKFTHDRNNKRLTGKDSGTKTSEELDQEVIDQFVSLTLGWENISIDGVSEFSKETAKRLYSNWKWAFEQVVNHIADRSNFI